MATRQGGVTSFYLSFWCVVRNYVLHDMQLQHHKDRTRNYFWAQCFTTNPISCDGEFHSRVDGTGFEAKTFRMRIRPEIILRRVKSVRFESDALSVSHADGMQQHAATLEEVPPATGRLDAVVETRNDARIHECP